MKIKITDDGNYLQLVEYTENEFEQLKFSMRRRIENWRWHPLVKKGVWDGYIDFMDKFNRIPIGLWNTVRELCKSFNFKFELEDNDIAKLYDKSFNIEQFEEWVWDFLKDTDYGRGGKKELRDYQIESAANVIKYRKTRAEIATSAGKTIIMFIVLAYLKEHDLLESMLIVVPKTGLIIQTHDDFIEDYCKNTRLEGKLISQMVYGETAKEKREGVDIIIGTYQSLTKLPKEWFDEINCICIDEAHHSQAKSIKDIIIKSFHSEYRFGLSGTLKNDNSAESYTLDAYLGPSTSRVSAKYLIDNSYATDVKIKMIELDYLDDNIKEKLYDLRCNVKSHDDPRKTPDDLTGTEVYNIERKVIIENRARFLYICDILSKTTKNSMVLFQDIKHGYGKKVYNYLRDNTNKKVYYVDGGTAVLTRDEYKNLLEEGNDKIIVASLQTFSTGISINNIHHIFLIETNKAENTIRQTIGRGMRLLEGKENTYLWDFVDDFRWKSGNRRWKKDNYSWRHSRDRIKIYKEQGFQFKKYKVKF